MRIKAMVEGALAGVLSLALSYKILIAPATFVALSIRRRFPHAAFSGLIVWYATFGVFALSVVIACVAFRAVYRHQVHLPQ